MVIEFSSSFLRFLNFLFCLELVSQGNVVITVAVEYDNIINVLQGLLGIAKALRPIVQLLPAESTTIVAAGAGAHLGAAVIGGLPKNVTFKKIIGKAEKLQKVLSTLEDDFSFGSCVTTFGNRSLPSAARRKI